MAGDKEGADEGSLTSEPVADEDAKASRATADAGADADVPQCMPCRGTGTLISNLGGTSTPVSCPWCGGTGIRQQGVDAQQRWREPEGASAPGER